MQSPLLDARTARVGCLVLRLTMDLVHPGTYRRVVILVTLLIALYSV